MDIEKIREFVLERVDQYDGPSELWLTHIPCRKDLEIEFNNKELPMDYVIDIMAAHLKKCTG